MKAGSIIGLLFAATIFATAPISPQVNRRMDRREFRQTRRAVRRCATID